MIIVDTYAFIVYFLREEDWKDPAQYMVQTISIDHMLEEFYNMLRKTMIIGKNVDPDYII